jgi:hypothetical protein
MWHLHPRWYLSDIYGCSPVISNRSPLICWFSPFICWCSPVFYGRSLVLTKAHAESLRLTPRERRTLTESVSDVFWIQRVIFTFYMLHNFFLWLVSLQHSHFVRIVFFHRLHLSLKMLLQQTKFPFKLLHNSSAMNQLLLWNLHFILRLPAILPQ